MFQAPCAVTSPVGTAGLGPLVVARQWSSWRQGTWTFTGGLASLELRLHELILEAGGEIVADTDPEALLVSAGNGLRGVVLEQRPTAVTAEHFVLGLGPDTLFSEQMLGDVVGSWLHRPRVVARRHSLHLRFRRGWLPGSMGRHLLLIDPAAEDQGPLRGLVSTPTLTDDEQVLTVEGTLPPHRCDESGLRGAEQRILSIVREVVPFFDDAYLRATSPHREHGIPLRPVYAVPHTSGQTPLLAGAPAIPPDLGLGNTALVHPLTLGALGTEGAFAAAEVAMDLLGAG
jgi:phytoene dehydrogenase-like protein